jgi:hypothetical protein
MEIDINTEQIAILAGIAVVAVFLAASIIITPDRGPKDDADGQKGADG